MELAAHGDEAAAAGAAVAHAAAAGYDLDAALTPQQRADAAAFRSLIEERLVPATVRANGAAHAHRGNAAATNDVAPKALFCCWAMCALCALCILPRVLTWQLPGRARSCTTRGWSPKTSPHTRGCAPLRRGAAQTHSLCARIAFQNPTPCAADVLASSPSFRAACVRRSAADGRCALPDVALAVRLRLAAGGARRERPVPVAARAREAHRRRRRRADRARGAPDCSTQQQRQRWRQRRKRQRQRRQRRGGPLLFLRRHPFEPGRIRHRAAGLHPARAHGAHTHTHTHTHAADAANTHAQHNNA
jgi:hypothetical protein